MSHTEIIHLASQAMIVTVKLAGPFLLVSLAIGVFVSLVQAVTQVQEMTLSFVPKLLGVAIVLVVGGGWMLQQLTSFTAGLYNAIPSLVH